VEIWHGHHEVEGVKYLQLFHSAIHKLLIFGGLNLGETTHCAAIFFVPGGAATIMNVNTPVTENITLMKNSRRNQKIMTSRILRVWGRLTDL